jgi:hypothetical protein
MARLGGLVRFGSAETNGCCAAFYLNSAAQCEAAATSHEGSRSLKRKKDPPFGGPFLWRGLGGSSVSAPPKQTVAAPRFI